MRVHLTDSKFTHVLAVDLDDHVVELEAGRLPYAVRAYLSALKFIEYPLHTECVTVNE